MAEVRALVPLEKRKEVVRTLHEKGKVQIESVDEEIVSELDLERESAPEALGEITDLVREIDGILNVFEKLPAAPRTRKEKIENYWNNFFKPQKIEKEDMKIESREEALEIGEETIGEVGSKVKDLDKKLEDSGDKIRELKEEIRSLRVLEKFNLDSLKVFKSSEFTFVEAGTLPKENWTNLKKELKKKVNPLVLRSREITEKEEAVCIWTLSENEEKTLETLNFHGFNSLNLPRLRGKPRKRRKELERKLQKKKKEKEDCLKKIGEISQNHKKNLLAVQEVLDIEKERAKAVNNFSKTETVTVIQGWVPKSKADEVESAISKASNGISRVKFSNPGNPDNDPPTLLQNPPILEKFEVLTKLFGIPGEGELDPTPLLAFTYILFFGIMLTDVVYGTALLLVSIGLFRGIGKTNKTMRDFSTILILGSLATIGAGLITGSYFGDLLREYVHITSYLPIESLASYNPIRNPVPLLLVSIFIGIFHEYLGISLGIWEKTQQGEWKKALGDGVSWLLLIPGASILICHSFNWVSFSSPTIVVGSIITITSISMILITQGPMGIMNMFSMLGNIMSYTRIMALALVTSSLALTFNAVASLGWNIPVIGVLIGALIFLGGQIFSLLINIISSFVHSLRLHFVEFFDKFYQGRGKEFKPFKTERVHTRG